MAKVFVSYSHEDRDEVLAILGGFEHHHAIERDEDFLRLGDPLVSKIQRSIRDADFVLVFLSEHSVRSPWVSREIYEVLREELEKKRQKLIPCLISGDTMPEGFVKWRTYERLYGNFIEKRDTATVALKEALETAPTRVFENENHFVIRIPAPGLEIYMTGEAWGWRRNAQCKYVEMLNSYLLFGFTRTPGRHFKHFVLCEEADAPRIRDLVQNAGYMVTGSGDIDPETHKRRIWFADNDYPIVGSGKDNRWPE